jgi:hypothetical protein
VSLAVRGTDLFVDADSNAGDIYVYRPYTDEHSPLLRLTVPQSAQLRALLERAEQVVSTGIGNMKERDGD